MKLKITEKGNEDNESYHDFNIEGHIVGFVNAVMELGKTNKEFKVLVIEEREVWNNY